MTTAELQKLAQTPLNDEIIWRQELHRIETDPDLTFDQRLMAILSHTIRKTLALQPDQPCPICGRMAK